MSLQLTKSPLSFMMKIQSQLTEQLPLCLREEMIPDDSIGQTSYTANGNDPLFVNPNHGLDGFFFANIMSGSGSKYYSCR
jgi:hypothetical protein